MSWWKMGVRVLLNKKDPLRCQLDKNGNPKKRSTDNNEAGNHAFETFSAAIRCVADLDIQKALWLQAEASRAGYALTLAEKFKKVLLEYQARDPSLRLDPEAILCDHRPLFCNSDDHWRLEHVPPRAPGDPERNFRSLGGIAENADGTCCYGHSHAPIGRGCAGGGVYEPPTRSKKGACREYRVDAHNKEGWRGGALLGCPAYTVFIPTGDPEVPQWCVTFKQGRSNGRGGCFGRVAEHEIIATVVGRAEPHNLKLGHPTQKRTLTIRENARAQGFPDYHVLLAKPKTSARFIRNPTLTQRFQQMGNAVSPQVAAALGRCLALAAAHESPPGRMLLSVPDLEYQQLVDKWTEKEENAEAPAGFYAEETDMSQMHLLDNIVAFVSEDGGEEEEGPAGQASLGPSGSGEDEDMAEGEEEEAPAPRRRQQKQKPRKQPTKQQQQQPARKQPAPAAAEEEAEDGGEEEAEAMDEDAPAGAGSEPAAAAAATGSDEEGVQGGCSEEEASGSEAEDEEEEDIGSEGQVAAGSREEEEEDDDEAGSEEEAAGSDQHEEVAEGEAGSEEQKEEEEEEATGSEEFEDAQELAVGSEAEADEATEAEETEADEPTEPDEPTELDEGTEAEGSETEADEEDVAAASGPLRRK